MKAALHPGRAAGLPATGAWLKDAEAARSVVMKNCHDASDDVRLHMLTEENIIAQLHNLSTHPSVAAKLARGHLNLHGWFYHIHSGEITTYDQQPRVFRPLDNHTAPSTARPRLQQGDAA